MHTIWNLISDRQVGNTNRNWEGFLSLIKYGKEKTEKKNNIKYILEATDLHLMNRTHLAKPSVAKEVIFISPSQASDHFQPLLHLST